MKAGAVGSSTTQILPRLLMIESAPACVEAGSRVALDSYGSCERRTWEACSPEVLYHSTAQVILAWAAPWTEGAGVFFRNLRSKPIPVPIIAVLPETADTELVRSVLAVAEDFLVEPVRKEELTLRLNRIVGPQFSAAERARQTLLAEIGLANLVGKHPSFLRAMDQVVSFASCDAPVLITGETGTGKELFAHAIHALSKRKDGPFVPLDCASLSEQLAEDELFGHARGAFTDAHRDRKGLAAIADDGTLFLDELDALSLANQAKFLRFLQEGTYRALGADRFTEVKVRTIAATNSSIEDLIRQRQFRNDLYFRMNVLRLHLPPLRERRGDVSLLARHFLRTQCGPFQSEPKVFSAAALRKLESHDWPGNVRELLNTVQRAALCSTGHQILPDHVILSWPGPETPVAAVGPLRRAKHQVVEEFERDYIARLLAEHGGNITHAARAAGKERRAFGRLAKKYGIGSRSA